MWNSFTGAQENQIEPERYRIVGQRVTRDSELRRSASAEAKFQARGGAEADAGAGGGGGLISTESDEIAAGESEKKSADRAVDGEQLAGPTTSASKTKKRST